MIKNIWFVLGPGGARMDFVSGWISNTFNDFIKFQWSIDFSNGKSWIFPMLWKSIDFDNPIDFHEIIIECENNFKYSPNSILLLPCHGYKLRKILNETHFRTYNFKFIKINYSERNIPKMIWEDIIKNKKFFEEKNPFEKFFNYFENFFSQEKMIDDSIEYIKQFGYEIIILNYDKISINYGSYHIIERLNLPSVRIEDHDFYNRNLKRSFSPEFITLNNQTLTKEYFVKKYHLNKEKLNVNQ